jgi:hypothetical protein
MVSDDFYEELNPLQLCKEFNKTLMEKKKYERIMKGSQFRAGNE